MEPFCRDLLKPESRKHAAARAAEQIGERVGERQHIVPPIDDERDDAERQDDADGGREGELIRQTDEPDEQRDEYHAAARAEKSVDKARGEYTVLADLITKALGKKPWDSLANIYAGGRSYIASFAHTVFEGMEMGDAVCRRIVEESAYKLSELTFAAEKYFPGEFPVVMSGGTFRAYPKYVQLVCAKASPKACMILAVVPPVYGALVEAMWQNGRTADAAVQP